MAVNGTSLGVTAAGVIFVFAGFKGFSVLQTIQLLVQGKSPAGQTQANAITAQNPSAGQVGSVSTVGGIPSTGSGQAAIQQAATSRGWGPGTPDWQPLVNLEMQEAGFSASARNPSSGAYGLAQALGHGSSGTQGTVTNEYGGYGLTDAQAQAANSGDAGAQAVWMMNYIAATYGNPRNAWAHEQTHNWY